MTTENEVLADAPTPETSGDWVFLEVMGHRSHHGLLTEVDRFGAKMARIDVFGKEDIEPRATHYYGGASIFSITPATEESCRAYVDRWSPKPAVQSLPAPSMIDYDDEGYDMPDDDECPI